MVTDSMQDSRRQFLIHCSALALGFTLHPLARASINNAPARLLAAWQLPNGGYQVGVLNTMGVDQSDIYTVELGVDLPTRPHGLMHLQGDDYLVLARRPGDWMMRLNIQTGETARTWQEESHHLNGHSVLHGDRLYTTETDLLLGSGVVGVRHPHSFELLDRWPTHGRDPHELLVLPNGGLGIEEPILLVANGGIHTHADMGRTQFNEMPMNSSVVALHLHSGRVLKQWTLRDSRLSLRHMAVHAHGVVGIAMQAHHNTANLQQASPVLALLDTKGLRAVAESGNVKGYAGDIAATPDGFVVSCTKNNSVAWFDVQGRLLGTKRADAACALASEGEQVWLGQQTGHSNHHFKLDNHWLLLQRSASNPSI